MAKELSVLQQQAEAIKTEVNKGANTSSRIGGMFGDMLEYNEEKLTELESNIPCYYRMESYRLADYDKIPLTLKKGDIILIKISANKAYQLVGKKEIGYTSILQNYSLDTFYKIIIQEDYNSLGFYIPAEDGSQDITVDLQRFNIEDFKQSFVVNSSETESILSGRVYKNGTIENIGYGFNTYIYNMPARTISNIIVNEPSGLSPNYDVICVLDDNNNFVKKISNEPSDNASTYDGIFMSDRSYKLAIISNSPDRISISYSYFASKIDITEDNKEKLLVFTPLSLNSFTDYDGRVVIMPNGYISNNISAQNTKTYTIPSDCILRINAVNTTAYGDHDFYVAALKDKKSFIKISSQPIKQEYDIFAKAGDILFINGYSEINISYMNIIGEENIFAPIDVSELVRFGTSNYVINADGSFSENSYGKPLYKYNVNNDALFEILVSNDTFYGNSNYYNVSVYLDDNNKKAYNQMLSNVKTNIYRFFCKKGSVIYFSAYKTLSVKKSNVDFFLSDNSAVLDNIESIINFPSETYATQYIENVPYIVNNIYIEGIAKKTEKTLRINGEQYASLLDYTTKNGDISKQFTLSAEAYNTITKGITTHVIDPNQAKHKLINPMFIGDSLFDNGCPACAKFIFDCINDAIGGITTTFVGLRKKQYTITLGEYNKIEEPSHMGYGGQKVSDFLRHPYACAINRFGTTETNSPDMLGKVAWDALGLGTQTRNGVKGRDYVGYTNTNTDGESIINTCMGYYDADPSKELWLWFKYNNITEFELDEEHYQFSDEYTELDDEIQKKAVLWLCKNPKLPFYDYDTVQTTNGEYAFNFDKFLSKYKTLADDGITRLEVGTTAGTLVTNVDDYDLCKPTHIIISMIENDQHNTLNGNVPAKDMLLMARLINEYDSNIKIAVGSTRGFGVFNPDSYISDSFVNYEGVSDRRLQADLYLKSNIVDYAKYLPIYNITTPIGDTTNNRKCYNTIDCRQIGMFSGDNIHADAPMGYMDKAYLITSWILSTL